MKLKLLTAALAIAGLYAGGTHAGSYTITTTADWDQGTFANTNRNAPPPITGDGRVVLDAPGTTEFHFIWVALSGRDAIAKIDVNVDPTGIGNGDSVLTPAEAGGTAVLGEYRSAPSGQARQPLAHHRGPERRRLGR